MAIVVYNFVTKRYDKIISVGAQGYFQNNAFGWSIVEPYAAQGPCPEIAPAMLSGLSVHNTATGKWDSVLANLAGSAHRSISLEGGSSNPCLVGDSSGPASMNFKLLAPNDRWIVTSPRQ